DAASLGERGRDVVDAAEHQLEDDRVERAVAEGQPCPSAFDDLQRKRRRLAGNSGFQGAAGAVVRLEGDEGRDLGTIERQAGAGTDPHLKDPSPRERQNLATKPVGEARHAIGRPRQYPLFPDPPHPAHSGKPPLPRERLVALRAFLASSRRSFEALVGLVGRRGRGATRALAINSRRRAIASARLRSRVRAPVASRIRIPSAVTRRPPRRTSRARLASSRIVDLPTSNRSWTPVETLLTF